MRAAGRPTDANSRSAIRSPVQHAGRAPSATRPVLPSERSSALIDQRAACAKSLLIRRPPRGPGSRLTPGADRASHADRSHPSPRRDRSGVICAAALKPGLIGGEGFLNVTPDSFSTATFAAPTRAGAGPQISPRRRHHRSARSTRPTEGTDLGEDELQRLQPVLPELVALGIPVSIDSMKSAVVAWALHQGAAIANDIWGLQRDSGIAGLVAERGAPVIIMHNRDSADAAIDIMQDIADFFARSLEIAAKAGISPDKIILDPSSLLQDPEQSMTALARLASCSLSDSTVVAPRAAFHQHGAPSSRISASALDCAICASQRGATSGRMTRRTVQGCGHRGNQAQG